MDWKTVYKEKFRTPEEAVKLVESGDRVYIGTLTSVAKTLAEALGERADELENVSIGSSNVLKDLKIMRTPGSFHSVTYYMGPGERTAYSMGNCDFTSMHLSKIDLWFQKTFQPTFSFIEVSAPNEDGMVSLGATGVSVNESAIRFSDHIIFEVNPEVPFVYGNKALVPLDAAEVIVEGHEPISAVPELSLTEEIRKISEFIVSEIPDGATIQLGIGGIGNAVGYGLKEKNDLGLHTEAFTDSMAFLMKNGNVTNARKKIMKGKSVACFALGTSELYKFLDHNEEIWFTQFSEGNDPQLICQNDRVMSINSCISIDLCGQVASDNIRGRQYSATGGQVDFVRGAQMSNGGKSFIAATATNTSSKTGKMTSRIVSAFEPGTAVTTSRADVQYVVTEFGAVDLQPLTMKDRAHALIDLAHPDFRPGLIEDAKKMGLY